MQTPLEQISPEGHAEPHAPQLFGSLRSDAQFPAQQFSPVAQSLFVAHVPEPPHWFGVPPPPQVKGAVHVPQSRLPPQPSESDPHPAPALAHVVGTQPLELVLELLDPDPELELLDAEPELELLVALPLTHAPPSHVSPPEQSALDAHTAPHTLLVAHASPLGQSELV
jgi:hypothetical protein